MSKNRGLTLYDGHKKSAGLAYALWFFLGMVGAHRFYLGDVIAGVLILALTVGGVLTATLGGISLLFLGVAVFWTLADLFLIPGIVHKHNVRLARRLC